MGNTKAKLMEVLSDAQNDDKVQKAFAAYDKDGDGTIDRGEAKKFAEDLIKIVTDNSPISKKQLLRGVSMKEYVNANFMLMDKDGNGSVSYDEFKEFLQSHSG
eukprot:CAMPEP_0168529444 /NCGR_PEP_ID=MMETSP0405-20121227/13919_1 /TAXON_ID=498012 /ORGANISM="Trichosphaerium sp, Strain Am-I-7 wt" /LENGTH=102 /DNA_ID=CAMNT_0008553183 /DNA_START=44 /DNA_END=352 /DNA_ORIENTATION=-